MSNILKAGLAERLGVPEAEATDEALLAAFDASRAKASIPEGVTAIEPSVLEKLQADAAAGRAALEAQTKARRDAIADKALREGRITAETHAKWRARLDDNEEGITELLDSLAPNKALPVAELGHQAEPTEVDSLYAQAWGADEDQEV